MTRATTATTTTITTAHRGRGKSLMKVIKLDFQHESKCETLPSIVVVVVVIDIVVLRATTENLFHSRYRINYSNPAVLGKCVDELSN